MANSLSCSYSMSLTRHQLFLRINLMGTYPADDLPCLQNNIYIVHEDDFHFFLSFPPPSSPFPPKTPTASTQVPSPHAPSFPNHAHHYHYYISFPYCYIYDFFLSLLLYFLSSLLFSSSNSCLRDCPRPHHLAYNPLSATEVKIAL